MLGTTSNAAPTLFSGTNDFKVELDQFAGEDGLRVVFRNAGTLVVNNIVIGFAERGEQIGAGNEPVLSNNFSLAPNLSISTRSFTLETYLASDGPSVTFPYQVTAGELDVFVNSPLTGTVRIATTDPNGLGVGETLLVRNAPATAVLSLARWANTRGLTVTFATRANNPTTGTVGAATIVLADGSRVASSEPNSTYGLVPVPTTVVTTGAYQFEVRLAESFLPIEFVRRSNADQDLGYQRSIGRADQLDHACW